MVRPTSPAHAPRLTICRTEHFRPLAPNPSTSPRAASRDLGRSRAISGDLGRSRVISGDLGSPLGRRRDVPLCVRSRPDLHCHRTSTRDYPRSHPRSPEATRGSRPTLRPTPWPRCSWSGRRTRGRRRAREIGGLALAYSDDGRGRWGAVVAQSREWECTPWHIIRGPRWGMLCSRTTGGAAGSRSALERLHESLLCRRVDCVTRSPRLTRLGSRVGERSAMNCTLVAT